MSSKMEKRARRNVKRATGIIYDEIKNQIDEMPFMTRLMFAWKILRGKW